MRKQKASGQVRPTTLEKQKASGRGADPQHSRNKRQAGEVQTHNTRETKGKRAGADP